MSNDATFISLPAPCLFISLSPLPPHSLSFSGSVSQTEKQEAGPLPRGNGLRAHFEIVQCESPLGQFPREQGGDPSVQAPRPLRISEVHGSALNGDKGDQGRGGRRSACLEETVMETLVGLQRAWAWSPAGPALVSEGPGVDWKSQASRTFLVSLLG